jgi:TM2 domain-containing membrane protein YozV
MAGELETTECKKTMAGILAIVIGFTGAHKFYLGNTKAGLMHLASNLLCLGGIIGLVEGIIYLTKPDAEFIKTYQEGKKDWF